MKVLIDNGHGINTPGKHSPDNRLREYVYTREIAKRLESELRKAGYDALRIVTEQIDITLSERCRRVNDICRKLGSKNIILVSIHNNAAGMSGWNQARGFSVFVSINASYRSKTLARCFTEAAEQMNLIGNRSVPPTKYWTQNLAICRDTLCSAVLTENLYQDNKEDVEFLLSDEGMASIVKLHFTAITNYIKEVTDGQTH